MSAVARSVFSLRIDCLRLNCVLVAWIEREEEPNRFLDFASGISNHKNKTPLVVAIS